ncbi:MAG: ATP-binding protein [Gammaproteobacteria bacterium HGW-Gammaproteobacteria-2]|jgi:nitrogen fixation/metabolism regulation signal transduction histidine kinase|nr:MAG: ATP-binding protein [Gammaproteobacteria bacterium HGW-Gammaproteobacteria-2]
MIAQRRRFSLAGKLALALALWTACWLALQWWLLRQFPDFDTVLAVVLAMLMLLSTLAFSRRLLRAVLSLFRALSGTVSSYRDNDFSFGIVWDGNDELGDLVAAHNALGAALREQRLSLVQRELLLDTMVQNTPVAMLLIAPGGHVVFANLSARRLLNEGRKLEGYTLDALLQNAPASLAEAVARPGDGLFVIRPDSADTADDDEVYHLARKHFGLNGRPHELLLLRQLTSELRRQEVQTWKKVIRVISHELNNSLAPIASLAHSGAELIRREQVQRIESIFATIEERARHLEAFINGYARFAKLPTPRVQALQWPAFIERLHHHAQFVLEGELPLTPLRADAAQLEQALLNLIKNAHESGSDPQQVQLRVREITRGTRIEVMDRGNGMSEAVLANALVPFYSTKRSGTGLGLALAREIAEAHGGSISLSNRTDGGLIVALTLPAA